MGMDLVGVGFTRRSDKECSVDALDALIDAIPDERILDETFLNTIDGSGYLGEPREFEEIEADDIRDRLKAGAREYDSAISGHRMTTYYEMGGTLLAFIWTGGGSWGDDPYDGFTDLCYFIELAGTEVAIAEAAGFVCGGLPNATIVNQYAGV